ILMVRKTPNFSPGRDMPRSESRQETSSIATSGLKRVAKSCLPPGLWLLLRRVRHGDETFYEYIGPRWPQDSDATNAWDDPLAVETRAANWEDCRRMAEGTAPWDRRPWNATVPDHYASNDLSSFALSLVLSAQSRERISVLDWGGAFGHYALIARTLLPTVEIEYTVKERPSI